MSISKLTLTLSLAAALGVGLAFGVVPSAATIGNQQSKIAAQETRINELISDGANAQAQASKEYSTLEENARLTACVYYMEGFRFGGYTAVGIPNSYEPDVLRSQATCLDDSTYRSFELMTYFGGAS